MQYGKELLLYNPANSALERVARIISIQTRKNETRNQFEQRIIRECKQQVQERESAAVEIDIKDGKATQAKITITPVC